MGAMSKRKGSRIERELVQLHKDIGVHCERYPLSGASRFRGSGHDIDIYVHGREAEPFVAEVKAGRMGQWLHHTRDLARRL
jgi:Holliday junction resolvase